MGTESIAAARPRTGHRTGSACVMKFEDTTWVFDTLVGFLQGPIWNTPVLTFIEEKCDIFQPVVQMQEEEHKKVHDEYKALVDVLLNSIMQDIGITSEQFEACCKAPNEGVNVRFPKALFEQVWAANDYEIFKRMMTQININLQLQTLDLIQQRFGFLPESISAYDDDELLHVDEETKLMSQVVKRYMEEYEATKNLLEESALDVQQSVNTPEERQRLEAESKHEKELLDSALQQVIEDKPPETKAEPDTEVDEQPKEQAEVDAEELAKRQAYLISQRDKLLAFKKTEREKMLLTTNQTCPHSAKAAQLALTGQVDVNPKTHQMRRVLAERLKSEVVSST